MNTLEMTEESGRKRGEAGMPADANVVGPGDHRMAKQGEV